MIPRTKKQNAILHQLLGKLRVDDEWKGELALQFSNGRTSKTSELSYHECRMLINELQNQSKESHIGEANNKMRRKICFYFRKCGYVIDDKTDMNAVYEWVLKYGYLKKPLNEYTRQELPKLVSQAQKIYESFISGIN